MRAEVCRSALWGGTDVSSIFCRQSPPVSAVHGGGRRWLLHAGGAPSAGRARQSGRAAPDSGALSYSGQQGRIGAQLAIEEINAAGGIKALGGAKIEAVLGDAQSTPEGGNAEVER